MEGLPENLPELEEPCPICILTKATKISRGPTTDVSKFAPGFMLQMDFAFFNVESIHRFTSTFLAICYATSYPIGFPSRRKLSPHDILKFLVAELSNQDKKVSFIWFDGDGALSRSSEFMKIFHNMNIIVQTTAPFTNFLWTFKTNYISKLIYQRLGHVFITILKLMARKLLMEGLPENLPELEGSWPICLFTKATKIPRDPKKLISQILPLDLCSK